MFEISGVTFLAFAEHVDNRACTDDGLGDGSVVPPCQTVETESHIFFFNPATSNPRGDCPLGDPTLLPGCQNFQGEFELLQTLRTTGAKGMHFFTAETTGARKHFLAVAQQRNDEFGNVDSAIYQWNGQGFGLFQKIPTDYAESFTSFVVGKQVFLVVANRGCPEFDRDPDFVSCTTDDDNARSQIWVYNVFDDIFVLQEETASTGQLHPFGADFDSSSDIDEAIIGSTAYASGIAAFALPSFNFLGLGDPVQYLAIANAKILATDTTGAFCPSFSTVLCHSPANLFSVTTLTTDVRCAGGGGAF